MTVLKTGPLNGLLILDMTRVLAGPYASMVLSDLGARVIKIEPPGGDDARQFGPIVSKKSSYYASLNRGKESISLDLKNAKDKIIFEKFLEKADVLIENYKPGTMKKLGYGWEILLKKHPSLIYAACSGFGQTGPWASKPAYDMIVQGIGGIMSLTGHEGQEPTRVGTSIGDITAGIFTVIGIQSAIIEREKNNKGQLVDVSMLDCQIAILENAVSRYFTTGISPTKTGSRHPSIAPFECYKCKDEYITIAAGNNTLFKKLCHATGLTNLPNDSKFSNNPKRLENAELLKNIIENVLLKKTAEEWIKILEKEGVPVGPLNDVKEAVNSEQVIARNMIVSIEGEEKNNLKIAGNPIKLSRHEDPTTRKKVSSLDEDRVSLLKEFGISF